MFKITSISVGSVIDIIQAKKSAEAFNAVLLQVCKGITERLNLDISGERGEGACRGGSVATQQVRMVHQNLQVCAG